MSREHTDQDALYVSCPFCGSSTVKSEWYAGIHYAAVRCQTCGTTGPVASTLLRARLRWNKRLVYADADADADAKVSSLTPRE